MSTDALDTTALAAFLDEVVGDRVSIRVERMRGGGSCEVFAVDRGDARWVLRRAPRRANTKTAHDVLREHRIFDAIKDEQVRIARPIAACADPEMFGGPFPGCSRSSIGRWRRSAIRWSTCAGCSCSTPATAG